MDTLHGIKQSRFIGTIKCGFGSNLSDCMHFLDRKSSAGNHYVVSYTYKIETLRSTRRIITPEAQITEFQPDRTWIRSFCFSHDLAIQKKFHTSMIVGKAEMMHFFLR